MVDIFANGKLRTGDYHINGGGFVESTAFVSPNAYIGPTAKVLDQAAVLDLLQVIAVGSSIKAQQTGMLINDVSQLIGLVESLGIITSGGVLAFLGAVQEGIKLWDTFFGPKQAQVQALTGYMLGQSTLSNQAIVIGSAVLQGHANVLEKAIIIDTLFKTNIKGYSTVQGAARVWDSTLSGNSVVGNNVEIKNTILNDYTSLFE